MPPRYEPWKLDVVVARAAAQEGVPLSFVDLDSQAEHCDVVAHRRSQLEKRIPQLVVGVAIERPLEELDQDQRQGWPSADLVALSVTVPPAHGG
ncbi:MAG: hypothetical protein V9E99_17665 [Microthrixaceae bacterium]